MHHTLFFLFLLGLSAASPPPLHHLRLSKVSSSAQLQEQIEVRRPLPSDNETPSCSLHLLSHSFGNTINLPPTNATYTAPGSCTWSTAVLHFSATSNGNQYDRIAAVWLSGVELLRSSTPEPTPAGIFWNVHKDVTRYSALLRRSNLTLSVMLENIVDDVYTGIYHVNITLHFYRDSNSAAANRRSLSTDRKLKLNRNSESLELDKNPADLIIPVSASGDEGGLWFKIQSENDAVYQGIQIPSNVYRAVLEVYVSAHGEDEFWYTNPPDFYLESNGLDTKRGHGSYREVLVKLDGTVVGAILPFPVIFTGGINPLFWQPVVAIGAFNLPSFEIELTPFLGILLNSKLHNIGFSVADAIPFWLIDANLHLWLDHESQKVEAGLIKFINPNNCVEREFIFRNRDGEFETEGERRSVFTGWVRSSAGNLTTHVTTRIEFDNEIVYKKNGSVVTVEHEASVEKTIAVVNPSGDTVASVSVETTYPLEMKTKTAAGAGAENYMVKAELEHAWKEEKKIGDSVRTIVNKQESSGWMFVHDHDVLSGSGKTSQIYIEEYSGGCYRRLVKAHGGAITTDVENFFCDPGLAASSSQN